MKHLFKWFVLQLVLGSTMAVADINIPASETVVFHHRDALGSIVVDTDDQGRSIFHSVRSPYGTEKARRSQDGTLFPDQAAPNSRSRDGFTGHIDDRSIELTYMQARFYDPLLGRFLSNDPVGYKVSRPGSFGRYGYAENNPLRFVDPDGREARLQTHTVVSPFRHAKVTIIPNNQAKYASDPRFQSFLPNGKRFATVGAGSVGGSLVSDENRPKDVDKTARGKNKYDVLLHDPAGRSDDELISDIFEAEANFSSNRSYSLFPRSDNKYNSNSFVSGLLNFLGIGSTETPPSNVPGYDKPVPTTDFEQTSTPNPHR